MRHLQDIYRVRLNNNVRQRNESFTDVNLRQPLAKEYRGDVSLGLTVALIFLFASSTILDGGQIFQFVGATTLVYCLGIVVIICRRPQSPTKADLWLVRFGFFILLLVVPMIIVLGWRLRGLI